MWTHPADDPSDYSSNGSSYFQRHTESTAGQPSGLLRVAGYLQGHSRGKLTTLSKGLTEPLGNFTSDGDDEKMTGEMSVGEII